MAQANPIAVLDGVINASNDLAHGHLPEGATATIRALRALTKEVKPPREQQASAFLGTQGNAGSEADPGLGT
jgi:hypothetical protein